MRQLGDQGLWLEDRFSDRGPLLLIATGPGRGGDWSWLGYSSRARATSRSARASSLVIANYHTALPCPFCQTT